MISQESIQEVKKHIDLVDVISDFVTLKKSGSNYKALSPFVNEKSASFYVVPSKGIFKDFASGKGGDAITFVMEHEGLTYIEVIQYLAKKYGVILKHTGGDNKKVDSKEKYYALMELATKYFQSNLNGASNESMQAIQYLSKRKMDAASIDKFNVGYALQEWNSLEKHALNQGYSKEDLIKIGLLTQNDKDKTFDRFRGRIIFPIHNLIGKVIGFGARYLEKIEDQPKYLNSPETLLYNKSEVLYGLYHAKNAIRKANECFLVEGYTDVISLHQVGIENVVSSSGTALTIQQLNLIKRFTSNLTIIYDGDRAGISAAFRGIDLALQQGLQIRVVRLPDGEDPDSYAKKIGQSLAHYIAQEKKNFISFKAQFYKDEMNDDPFRKAQVVKELIESIGMIPDAIERSVLIKEVSRIIALEEQVLISELNKKLIKEKKVEVHGTKLVESAKKIIAASSPKVTADMLIQNQERELIRVLLNYGDSKIDEHQTVSEWILDEVSEVEFQNETYRLIIGQYLSAQNNKQILTISDFINHPNEEIRKIVSTVLVTENEVSENWKEKHNIDITNEQANVSALALGSVQKLKLRIIQKMIDENIEKMKAATADESDAFISVHQNLKKAEMELASQLGITISRGGKN